MKTNPSSADPDHRNSAANSSDRLAAGGTRRKHVAAVARWLAALFWVATAAAIQAIDFTYTVNYSPNQGTWVAINGYIGSGGAAIIPDTIEGYPVKDIGYRAFAENQTVTNVTVGNNVTYIGGEAFRLCTNLRDVQLPGSLRTIEGKAFFCCYSLASLTLPGNLATIGETAFGSCTNLPSVTLPASVTSLGPGAFGSCSSLAWIDVAVENPAYSSLEGVLFDKNWQTLVLYPMSKSGGSYTTPGGVLSIASLAFYHCAQLTSLRIGDSVTSIGAAAFSSCHGLTNLTIGNGVTTIGTSAFDGCSALTGVTLGHGLTQVGGFASCTNLVSVTLGHRVTTIEDHAFENCLRLAEITIPDSVTSIGHDAFFYCTNLATLALGQSHASIGDHAFQYCTRLTSLLLPGSVPSIGGGAFSRCYNLASVTLGQGVTNIGESAFDNCGRLAAIAIPDSVTSLGANAFLGCYGLTNATIGAGVISLGQSAFRSCPSLNAITVDASNSFYCGVGGVLFDKSQTTLIQAPGRVAGNYTVPAGVTHLGIGAFASCSGLTAIRMAGSVTSIGLEAFRECLNLTRATIPASVTNLGEAAFRDCSALTGLYFLGNAPSVGWAPLFRATNATVYYVLGTTGWPTVPAPWNECPTALWEPQFLLTVTGGTGSGSYSNGAWVAIAAAAAPDGQVFDRWTGPTQSIASVTSAITGLTMPAQDVAVAATYRDALLYVTNKGAIFITGYTGLDGALSIPGTIHGLPVTHLAVQAFAGCASLTRLTLPPTVASLGDQVFQNCPNLTEVCFQGNAPSLGSGVFAGASRVTIYHQVGTTGWPIPPALFGGCPTALWQEAPLVATPGILAAWDFYGLPMTPSPADVAASLSAVSSVPRLSRVGLGLAGSTNNFIAWQFPTNGTLEDAVNAQKYFAFNLSNATPITVAGVSLCLGRSGSFAPTNFTLRVSADAGFSTHTDCHFETDATGAFYLRSASNLNVSGTTVYFQFYGYGSNIGPNTAIAGFAGTTNAEPNAANSGLDGTLYDLIVYGASDFIGTTNPDATVTLTGYTGSGGAVTVPDTFHGLPVTGLGSQAFFACSNLTRLTIPARVTQLGQYAFYHCTLLTEIYFLGNAPSLAAETFNGAGGATVYYLPGTTGWPVPPALFGGRPTALWHLLYALTVQGGTGSGSYTNGAQVPIAANPAPDGQVFLHWTGDTQFVAGVTSATTLLLMPPQAVSVTATYKTIGDYTYRTNDGSITITGYTGSGGAVTIPDTIAGLPVRRIEGWAFDQCTTLTSLAIPESVTDIGWGAFGSCVNLARLTVAGGNPTYSSSDGIVFDKNGETLTHYPGGKAGGYTIPDQVVHVDDGAFYACSRLTSVTIGDRVTTIGNFAFAECGNLTSVTLGGHVTSLGDLAFDRCGRLTGVTLPASVTNIGWGAFGACASLGLITVAGANPAYSSLEGVLFDQSRRTLLQYPGGKVGAYTIPASVTHIGEGAFSSCLGLTSVTLGHSVTSLGGLAFFSCPNLTGLYFQGPPPNLSYGVFDGDDEATVYYLPGASGWEAAFGGRPTALWKPVVRTGDRGFGVRTNQFGFSMKWASGRVLVVEGCLNLAQAVWVPLQTNLLDGDAAYFSDPHWTNHPGRFYRLRSP